MEEYHPLGRRQASHTQGSDKSHGSHTSKRSRRQQLIEQQEQEFLRLDLPTVKSVNKCEEGLVRFWDIHVVGYAMPSIRSLPPVEARAADAQQTCCFLLSDPRCALRTLPQPMDSRILPDILDESVTPQAQSSGVKSVFKQHLRLMKFAFIDIRSFSDLTTSKLAAARRPAWVPQPAVEPFSRVPSDESYVSAKSLRSKQQSRQQTGEGAPKAAQEETAIPVRSPARPSIFPKMKDLQADMSTSKDELEALERKEIRSVATEQQRIAAALVEQHLGSGSLIRAYERLSTHPSVSFLYGWLCYKAGTSKDLFTAISLLSESARHPLLQATAALLCALCRFFIVQGSPIEHFQVCHEFVKADLKAALGLSKRPTLENASAEIPLLIEANSALAILFMLAFESSAREFQGPIKEVQRLKATKHCTEAQRLYRIWIGTKTPSRLLQRASKLCNMELPGSWEWAKGATVLSGFALKWQQRRMAPPTPIQEEMISMANGKGSTKTQIAPYESCATILPDVEQRYLSKMEEEGRLWSENKEDWVWMRQRNTANYCQVCGGSGAGVVCNRCGLVWYCSSQCQTYDRMCGAHPTFCWRDPAQEAIIYGERK